MRSAPVQFDREKLKEAVWLISDYCDPDELGNVKLHKILYFSDMLHYLEQGTPLTGVEYLKQKFGPTARHLSTAVRSLEGEGLIRTREENFYGFYKKSYDVVVPYRAQRLSDPEQALLRDVTDFVRGRSAKAISELSHNAAWEAAELGDVLPYYSSLSLIPEEITDDDRAWAREAAQTHAYSRPE